MADFQLQLGLLKFEDVRTAIKKYFKEIKGIEYFEGNNFSILIDALSYLQEMFSYQLSQQANNVYTRTCSSRKTAVENAYKLGYNPHRKIPNRIICSKEGGLVVSVDKTCYGKRTGLPYLLRADSTIAYQEETKKIYIPATGLPNQKITLPTINISNTPITVKVTLGLQENQYTLFDIYDQLPTSESLIFFVNESENEYYTDITFGNGILGKIPETDSVIEITYYESFGEEGNDEIGLVDEETPEFFDNVVFVSANSGRQHEQLESIKINASKYHSSRGRLITKNDYENFFKGQYTSVDVSENVGGINYYYSGNIYVSLVQSNIIIDIDDLNTELNKTENYTDLKLLNWKDEGSPISYIGNLSGDVYDQSLNDKKIIGTSILYSSPSYIYCDVVPKIESNITGYKFSTVDLKQFRNSLMGQSLNDLTGFGVDFRTDYFSKQLFNQSDSIKSVKYDIEYKMIFDDQNIYDTYTINLPNDFVASNEDYYNLDNNLLGNFYSRSQQPIDRRALYSKLKSKTNTEIGLEFDRYLYSGVMNISNNDFFTDALIFDIRNNTIENIQSFPIFNSGVSYILTIDGDSIKASLTTGNDTTEPHEIGKLVKIDNYTYYIQLNDVGGFVGGSNLNLNEYINYTITKQSDTRFRVVIKMFGNTVIGDNTGKPSMSIYSMIRLGTVYTTDNRINFEGSDLGNFEVQNSTNDELVFSISSSDKFIISQTNINGFRYEVGLPSGIFTPLSTVRTPILIGNDLYIAEKGVDGTTLGEFDNQNSRILLYEFLGSINNSEITEIISLQDYISNNSILQSGIKYNISIKPKYYIDNGVLKYKYDFDKKSGLYTFININTLRNN